MWSSSQVRPPKLQFAAEQLSTGECWIPPQKATSHPRAKEKPEEDGRRGEITFRMKPHTNQRGLEGSNKNLSTPGEPTETEPDLLLSVSCGGMGQQWPAAGQGLWMQTWVWHKPSWRRLPLTPP